MKESELERGYAMPPDAATLAADPEVQASLARQREKNGVQAPRKPSRDLVNRSWLEAPGASEAMDKAQAAALRLNRARTRAHAAGLAFQFAKDELAKALEGVEKIKNS